MAHCPACGETTPEEARACPFCGRLLSEPGPPALAARTIAGVSVRAASPAERAAAEPAQAAVDAAPPAGVMRVGRTIVGMPGGEDAAPVGRRPEQLAGGPQLAKTVQLGTPAAMGGPPAAAAPEAKAAPVAGAARAARTLVGVAQPGIAPLAAGGDARNVREVEPRAASRAAEPSPATPDPPRYQPARELGATVGAIAVRDLRLPPGWEADQKRLEKHARRVNIPPKSRKPNAPAPPVDEGISRRALAVVLAAGGLALAAVLVALLWPNPPPLTARPRADSSGREGVELTCKSCPDGSKVTIAGNTAVVHGGAALVPLPAALSIGENRLRVEIDRPGSGRDETVGVTVHVAYRIRPDLAALQAERPAFQIIAEAATGTTVTIDGRKIPLASGRAVESVEVTGVCTGLSNDVKTLARQIPYTIAPPSGPAEQGVVNISVGIVPLHVDAPVAIVPAAGSAPDPHVITDGPSFVLAGWTMKGAEVLAAGRPITVHADGSFAQVMNVSSVGSTQIEVRARMAGMAPRLTSIKVRRVESLEKAARDFAAEPTLGYREIMADLTGSIGKAVTLTGEVAEAKKQGYQTVMLLDVASAGCSSGCTVRLVQGADNAGKRGDTLRVFGHVARAFSVPGRADIPEIEVDFTLKGEPAGKGAK